MIDHGSTVKDMSEYLDIESENLKKEYDENFMGLYGVIDGEFLDGLGQNPPDDLYNMAKKLEEAARILTKPSLWLNTAR